ncbi:MAG TPA: TIGR01620 family protein [Hyphomicrobium sp.]|nr:TIGR01620 family protein [Hyphomicrobium sp.]
MTETRRPRVFAPDDPKLVADAPEPPPAEESARPDTALDTAAARDGGTSVGGLFLSAVAAIAGLAIMVSFASFVSAALAREDWIGWIATALLAVILATGLVMAGRELVGLVRLGRLTRLRREAEAALAAQDRARERDAVAALASAFGGRRDLAWNLARLRDHAGDVRDPGDLLRLADRELLAPLDATARRLVVKSAKRVSVVTAMSPMVWVGMLFVTVENLRLLKSLAALYGGRPGGLGALRLARMVIAHIVATGGLALTDDLVGQFLGQDLLRRLSRRLGEGVFNGALTARIGTAAIEVTRPLPFLDAEPVRVRDLLPELLRRPGKAAT